MNNRFAVIETSTPFSRLCRTDGLLITDYRLARRFLSFMLFLSFLPVFFLATFFLALRRILTNSSIKASTGSCFFALRRIHTRASRRLSTASCSFAMQHSTSSCQPVHPRNPHRLRGCPPPAEPSQHGGTKRFCQVMSARAPIHTRLAKGVAPLCKCSGIDSYPRKPADAFEQPRNVFIA